MAGTGDVHVVQTLFWIVIAALVGLEATTDCPVEAGFSEVTTPWAVDTAAGAGG